MDSSGTRISEGMNENTRMAMLVTGILFQIRSFGMHPRPEEAQHLHKNVDDQPAKEAIQACSTPWPEVWSVQHKAQREMPPCPEAEGEDNPLSCQGHATRLLEGEEDVTREAHDPHCDLDGCLG